MLDVHYFTPSIRSEHVATTTTDRAISHQHQTSIDMHYPSAPISTLLKAMLNEEDKERTMETRKKMYETLKRDGPWVNPIQPNHAHNLLKLNNIFFFLDGGVLYICFALIILRNRSFPRFHLSLSFFLAPHAHHLNLSIDPYLFHFIHSLQFAVIKQCPLPSFD